MHFGIGVPWTRARNRRSQNLHGGRKSSCLTLIFGDCNQLEASETRHLASSQRLAKTHDGHDTQSSLGGCGRIYM